MGAIRFFVCLFLLLLSSISLASEIDLESGLVAHYKFDGDFTDSSGTGNHGTQQGGVTFVEGIDGQAAYFDGNDDLVSVPHTDSLALDQNLSISLWVKPEYRDPVDIWVDTTIILIKNNHVGNNYSLWTERDALSFTYQQYYLEYPAFYGNTPYTFKVEQPILSNDFVNIIVVRSSNSLKMYLDGNEVFSQEINYSSKLGSSPLTIGGGNVYSKYKGYIDDLKIYDRALSELEVMQLVSPDDIDLDGLPGDYEAANGLNPDDSSDAQSDSDMDGLTALEEFNLGTSPTNDDTDRDTLPDGWEVDNGRDPLVADYQVSVGFWHTCVIDDSGVVCWGWNGDGRLDVPVLNNPSQVSAGGSHTCVLDDSGVVCWGNNNNGQTNAPTFINPTQVSSGAIHSCALDDSGIACWGNNSYGQLNVPSLINPTQISVGDYHTCVLDDSDVFCWGDNQFGQTVVPVLSNPTDVSAGEGHTCAIDDTGVVCWGRNGEGQIDVPALSNPSLVLGGYHQTCALDDSGVVCWGRNEYGQNTVPALNKPTQVSSGYWHVCALDDSGVVCWGHDSEYQPPIPMPNLMIDAYKDGFSDNLVEDTVDTNAPEVQLISADSANGFITISYNEKLSFTSVPNPGDYVIKQGGNHLTVSNVTVDTNNPQDILLTIDNSLDSGALLVVYVPSDSLVQDINGNESLDGFSSIIVSSLLGYIRDSEIYVDRNENNLAEADELLEEFTTDEFGQLILPESFSSASSNIDKQLIIQGGINMDTGEPNEIQLTAPVGYSVINPLSTLVAEVVVSGVDIAEAETKFAEAFGIEFDSDSGLGSYDLFSDYSDSAFENRVVATQIATILTVASAASDSLSDDGIDPEGAALSNLADIIINWEIGDETIILDPQMVTEILTAENEILVDAGGLDSIITAIAEMTNLLEEAKEAGFDAQNEKLMQIIISISLADDFDFDADDEVDGIYEGQNFSLETLKANFLSPYRPLVHRNDQLEIGTSENSPYQEILWRIPVLDNDYIDESDEFTVIIEIEEVRVPGLDRDFIVGISDGSKVVNFANAGLGYRGIWIADDMGDSLSHTTANSNNFGDDHTHYSATFAFTDNTCHLTFTDLISNNQSEHSIQLESGTFDRSKGLELVLIGNEADENFVIKALSITYPDIDSDGDGIFNLDDTDDDNDGAIDEFDAFPLNPQEQMDTDSDGIGNNADTDADNDGIMNEVDSFPYDAFESADSDGDGVGDNTDFFPNTAEYSLDSDLDQMPDAWERKYGLNPSDASDALLDQDNDGMTALEEFEAGTIPLRILDIDANGSFDALSDGLIILRYAFGLRGDNLITGAISENSMRTDAADIEAYIESLIPGI
jgi:hypothetical protein